MCCWLSECRHAASQLNHSTPPHPHTPPPPPHTHPLTMFITKQTIFRYYWSNNRYYHIDECVIVTVKITALLSQKIVTLVIKVCLKRYLNMKINVMTHHHHHHSFDTSEDFCYQWCSLEMTVCSSQTKWNIYWKILSYLAISCLVQGLRASSLQFTSPLEFNASFRDGFPYD